MKCESGLVEVFAISLLLNYFSEIERSVIHRHHKLQPSICFVNLEPVLDSDP